MSLCRLTIFIIFLLSERVGISEIFCTFATESDFPKWTTFWKFENEKLSKTENFAG
jgi:hypothetical protein